MIRFNGMTEAEKFSITKEMINARDLVLALRPELNEQEREIVIARRLSKKLGGNVDISLIGQCNAFAIEKTGKDVYSKFEFDEAKDEYISKIESDTAEKDSELKKAKKETQKIQNKLLENQRTAQLAKSKKRGAKFMLWSSIAVIGLTTFGNFSAIVGGITGFLLGLPAVGFAVFALTAYFGLKIIQNFVMPKLKGMYKGSIDALEKLPTEAEQAQAGIETELNNTKTAQIAAEQESLDFNNKLNREKDILNNNYKNTTDIDNSVTLALRDLTIEAQRQYNVIASLDNTDPQKEKRRQNVNELKKYYTGIIFRGVESGQGISDEQIRNSVERAKIHMKETVSDEFPPENALAPEQKQELENLLITEGVR